MVKLYRYYLLIAITPIVINGFIAIWLVYRFDPALTYIPAAVFSIPLAVIVGFFSGYRDKGFRRDKVPKSQ